MRNCRASEGVKIRSVRDSVVMFGVGASAVLYVVLTIDDPIADTGGKLATWTMSAALGLGAGWLCLRSWGVGVRVSPKEVVVTNLFRTTRVSTREVICFEAGRLRIVDRPAVAARTEDGRMIVSAVLSASLLDVTTNSSRVQRFVDLLNDHLDEAKAQRCRA